MSNNYNVKMMGLCCWCIIKFSKLNYHSENWRIILYGRIFKIEGQKNKTFVIIIDDILYGITM